jgi:hypothetical protein
MEIGKSTSITCKFVNIRSSNFSSIATNIRKAQVIRQNDEKVRLFGGHAASTLCRSMWRPRREIGLQQGTVLNNTTNADIPKGWQRLPTAATKTLWFATPQPITQARRK